MYFNIVLKVLFLGSHLRWEGWRDETSLHVILVAWIYVIMRVYKNCPRFFSSSFFTYHHNLKVYNFNWNLDKLWQLCYNHLNIWYIQKIAKISLKRISCVIFRDKGSGGGVKQNYLIYLSALWFAEKFTVKLLRTSL